MPALAAVSPKRESGPWPRKPSDIQCAMYEGSAAQAGSGQPLIGKMHKAKTTGPGCETLQQQRRRSSMALPAQEPGQCHDRIGRCHPRRTDASALRRFCSLDDVYCRRHVSYGKPRRLMPMLQRVAAVITRCRVCTDSSSSCASTSACKLGYPSLQPAHPTNQSTRLRSRPAVTSAQPSKIQSVHPTSLTRALPLPHVALSLRPALAPTCTMSTRIRHGLSSVGLGQRTPAMPPLNARAPALFRISPSVGAGLGLLCIAVKI